jgi:hypothetical protein
MKYPVPKKYTNESALLLHLWFAHERTMVRADSAHLRLSIVPLGTDDYRESEDRFERLRKAQRRLWSAYWRVFNYGTVVK